MVQDPVAALRVRLGRLKLRSRRSILVAISRGYRRVAGRKPAREGITVVTVNYNSLPQLRVLLATLARFTDQPVDVLVVDNGSTDGSREFLRAHPTVRPLLLPLNVGHGVALDLGVSAASTTKVVVLDVDAFPVSPDWLRSVIAPLDAGSVIAGAHLHRAYIHPCFLALRRSDFVDHRLSFVPVGVSAPTGLFLDAGEVLSHRLSMIYGSYRIHRIPATSIRGPGMIGTVFGDVVYHNFYSTHAKGELGATAAAAWREAVDQYVGTGV